MSLLTAKHRPCDSICRFLTAVAFASLLAVLTFGAAEATETRRWIADTAEELLKGEGEGVAVTVDGRLVMTSRWSDAAVLTEPVVMAGALVGDGTAIVGTGHPARLYRVRGNRAELLTEIPGEQVTAVFAGAGSDILVATVTPAALYRFAGGRLEEIGRLGDGGIWDLVEVGGTVVAAAGPPAALYRVTPQGLVRWVELPDAHARCLTVVGDRVMVGTSGRGLVFSVDRNGQIGLLTDSPFTEISDMLATPDGSLWATALVGEPVQATPRPTAVGDTDKTSENSTTTTSSSVAGLELPKVNGSTATSELVRLTPDGAVLSVHRFTRQVATALANDGDGVLVGTGFEGEVWRFTSAGGARLLTADAVQIVGLLENGAALLTQGPGSVRWRSEAASQQARFRGPVHRVKVPARLGQYRIEPAGVNARVRFRSGASAEPDGSWLPWSQWFTGTSGAVPLPTSQSIQWELELGSSSSVVERVEVAYRQINLPPRLTALTVEAPGVVYLSGPPPSGPVIDAANPDFNGIFTVIDEGAPGRTANGAKGKKFWRVGYRTVTWKGEDPNSDPVRFRVDVENRDGFRLPVRESIRGTRVAVDTTALPDGWYRFVVTAYDDLENPGDGLQTTGTSRWFVVDNTPPEVSLDQRSGRWVVTASDDGSSIARAEWSRDGEKWQVMAPSDGVLDGAEETFDFAAGSGRHLVVVRVLDRHHNRMTVGEVEQ